MRKIVFSSAAITCLCPFIYFLKIVIIPRQVPSTAVVTSTVISVDVVVLSFGVLVVEVEVGRRGSLVFFVENKVDRWSVVCLLVLNVVLVWEKEKEIVTGRRGVRTSDKHMDSEERIM